MRLIIILGVAALLAGAGAGLGCGGAAGAPGAGDAPGAAPEIAAAFYPLAWAAGEVAPPDARVNDLTPPGAEPHALEPVPAEIERLRSADHVFLLGHGFQPALEEAAGDGDPVTLLLDTPALERRGDDPHVWLDPLRFAVIARRIGAELGEPRRAARLAGRLRRLHRRFRAALARCERRELVTSHDAFSYLARRYDLETVPVSGINPEAEPSPRSLARVVAAVRERDARTVFTEPLGSKRVAEAIARETGARVSELNPIETLTPQQRERGDDYFALMEGNLRALRAGLGCS